MRIKIVRKIATLALTGFASIVFGAALAKAFVTQRPSGAFAKTLTSLAVPGDLDPTFGVGGKVIDASGYESYDVAIQPDGKIVAVGLALGGSEGTQIAVVRYNDDGSPDTTFGGTGRVLIDRYGVAMDVAIQPDGKIVVASRNNDGEVYGELVRLNSDGSLDTSFGTNGIVAPLFLPSVAAFLPDGKLLIALAARLFRLNANGSFDTTFSPCGPAVTTVHYLYNRSESVIQPDGRILTAFTLAARVFGVFRCNADGTLDTAFGSGGVVITAMTSGISVAHSIALQLDGKIVVTGQSQSTSDWKLSVVRYNANGSLDPEFGAGGIVTSPTGITHWLPPLDSVAIQTDGKIVASTTIENGSNRDFALVRFNPNGSLDTTFSGDGKTTADFDISNDNAYGMALDNVGSAVVVGESNGRFALARFLLAPRTSRFDFDGDGRSDLSVFRPTDSVWYLNQSTTGFSAVQFGLSTDKITPADYDGDGKTDISVYRDGTWYWIDSSSNSFSATQFGLERDVPVAADFTGDGRAELAIYRNGSWWTLDLSNNQTSTIQFGLPADKPVVADYDGDGRADQAVYRNGDWHLNRSTQGYTVVQFGLPADKPVVGDYDGDGRADQAVFRDGTWYVLRSEAGFTAFQFGLATDTPAPADYDGDGKTDAAVYRDGVWYLLQSTSGFAARQFGVTGDKPVPSAYLP